MNFKLLMFTIVILSLWTSKTEGRLKNDDKTLRFNSNSKFKIVQFTDLHFGENPDTWWGPFQDKGSLKVMGTILDLEKPDLVVLTGDMLTGNNIVDNATAYWKMMVSPMDSRNISWAATFGNHDALASGKGGTRKDLMTFDISFFNSRSKFGPENIEGVSNYILPIVDAKNNERVRLYILDSNAHCPQMVRKDSWPCFNTNQVEWVRSLALNSRNIPSFAYFHVPIVEFGMAWNCLDSYGTNNDSVAYQGVNAGLYAVAKEMGNFKGIFVGHNHGNDYCSDYYGIQLCFGRHSGYGGYGKWEKGARVVELSLNGDSFNWDSWIRFERGRVEKKGQIHHPPKPKEGDIC